MNEMVKNSFKVLSLLFLDIAAFYCSLLSAYYVRTLLDVLYPHVFPVQLELSFSPYLVAAGHIPVVHLL